MLHVACLFVCFCCNFVVKYGLISSANVDTSSIPSLFQAYTWGFDIRCWQRLLNPLTWPEILRQFALSAGFGPKLKKRSVEQAYRDENEVGTLLRLLSFVQFLGLELTYAS